MIDIRLIEECRSGNLNNFRKVVEASTPFAFSVAFRRIEDNAELVLKNNEIAVIVTGLTSSFSLKQKAVFILSDLLISSRLTMITFRR